MRLLNSGDAVPTSHIVPTPRNRTRGAARLRPASSAQGKAAEPRRSSADEIRAAAITLFKKHGYNGTPVRAIADAVGIEAASLYYHFPSKQDILVDLVDRIMDALASGFESAIAGETTATDKLRAGVRFHVLCHIARQEEAFVSHSELRSLTTENRRRIFPKRDRYERMMRDLLAAGVRSGEFDIPDVQLTAIAILMMCSGVSDWFEHRGRLGPGKIADRYAEMAVRLVTRR